MRSIGNITSLSCENLWDDVSQLEDDFCRFARHPALFTELCEHSQRILGGLFITGSQIGKPSQTREDRNSGFQKVWKEWETVHSIGSCTLCKHADNRTGLLETHGV